MHKDIFPHPDEVLIILRQELELHPLARPIDMYKLLIQAAFGPGHLIANEDQAIHSILTEMENPIQATPKPYQSLDAGFGYIRYHLSNLLPYKAISDTVLENKARELAQIMIKSCYVPEATTSFSHLWNRYLPELKHLLKAPKEEWKQVQMLACNNQIPSHSQVYKSAYDPHYRVINKLLMPF